MNGHTTSCSTRGEAGFRLRVGDWRVGGAGAVLLGKDGKGAMQRLIVFDVQRVVEGFPLCTNYTVPLPTLLFGV